MFCRSFHIKFLSLRILLALRINSLKIHISLFDVFAEMIHQLSGFQPVCRGTLVCRERSAGMSRKILEKNYLGTSNFERKKEREFRRKPFF